MNFLSASSLAVLLAACLVAGCSGGSTSTTSTTSTGSTGTAGSTGTTTTATFTDTTDLTKLPIGDGRYVTTPAVGYIYSCQTTFTGGGASSTGSWYNSAANTFDYTSKVHVSGSVTWASALFTIALKGTTRTVSGNNLPISHATGTFPVGASDPAAAYDRNPNTISAQTISYALPAMPTAAASPGCLPGGPIGVMLSGVQIFNALDAGGRDAVAHEMQDNCDGHPQGEGTYHYHSLTNCIADAGTGHSALVGYAYDGYGIYGSRGESGQQLTNADLDACHGHTHSIVWDGATVNLYHYHATRQYPYTLGCFHGTQVTAKARMTRVPRPAVMPADDEKEHHHEHAS